MLFEKREVGGWISTPVQHLVEEQPVDAAPHAAQLERRRVPELLDGDDAGAVKPLLHARADAVDLLQFETQQNIGQIVLRDDDQPVRLLQVGTDLAEKDVRGDADRAGEALSHLVPQRAFNLERKLARDRDLALGAHQAARHFVDRADLLDRHAGVDGLEDALVIFGIEAVIGLHRDHVRAQPPRLAHEGAGFDAERLGRVAGGDRDGGIRRGLHHDDGPAAQGRGLLLLARRKEGVEIEEQPLHRAIGR
jgi:hypothetical protein